MITSSSNPQMKYIQQLNSKARFRREEGCFAAEGLRLFRETPERLKRKVYVSGTFASEHPEILSEGPSEVVDDRVFAKICDTKTPQGILTLVSMPSYSREDLLGSTESPLVLVLEDLQDPGNVGTIIRTAEGAGVTGIFLGSHTADIFQPKVIRSTMGSIYRVPVLRENDLAQVMIWLKNKGIRSFAAHLRGTGEFTDEDYRGGSCFLIGNEGNGLSGQLTDMADTLIRIPMEGSVESLNAAVASALLMYEARRQRNSR